MPMFFVCFMCFVAGGCLTTFMIVCSGRPGRKVMLGWVAYFALIMALAWRLGGLML